MFGFLIGLIIVVAILLILVVLAQNSKGGGLSSQFGGSSTAQMIGVKKTSDLLEKLTWGLAIGLFLLTISTDLLIDDNFADDGINSPNIERATESLPELDPSLIEDASAPATIESLSSDTTGN